MRRFAKNDNSAICNYCGKWQPTDLTNQQLEEMDWKCDECKAKEQPQTQPQSQPATPPTADRGSKEISKYDPEYAFLVKLVKLLTSEGVPPQEIKSIADAYPFVTVDDVGDLTAKLWTLATEKYHIPREWLIKRLPKNASLKRAELWPAQEEAEDMINHAPGYIAYEYGQDKTADGEFTGAEFSTDDVGVNPTLDSGPFSSPEDHGAKPQKQPFPNTGWLPADDENKDEQPYSNIASWLKKPFSKKGSIERVEVGSGELDVLVNPSADELLGLEMRAPSHSVRGLIDPNTGDLYAWKAHSAIHNELIFALGLDVDYNAISGIASPYILHFSGNSVTRMLDYQKEVRQGLKQSVASAFKRPFSKIAGLDGRYWIAPDGQEFNAGTHHGAWVNNHLDVLKSYGLKGAENISEMYNQMLASGWTRVSNERGFTIQVADLNRIPAYLDDFIAKHYQKGDVIRIGTDTQMVEVSDPFPSLQKAVNKQLRRASLKEADLSGQTVNQIVNALHANGGATWNLSQGNMVGTDNYAVSIYPERAQILDGADFDRIEEYITSNSDLLDNPENSFGAWSHDGKVYLDVVATIPDLEQAKQLGAQHNQIAIWDLKNGKQISTGGTGEVKQAAQNDVLPQQLQDQIAAETSPAYNIALNNYAQAVRRGHEKDRSLEYAIESVSNIDKIDPKKLVELINTYL